MTLSRSGTTALVGMAIFAASLVVEAAHADMPPLLWRREVSLREYGYVSAVAANSAGDVIVAGPTNGPFGGPNKGGTDIFVAVFSPDGTLRLRRHPGSSEGDGEARAAINAAGNFAVAGSTQGSIAKRNEGKTDGFVISYSSTGLVQWRRQPASRKNEVVTAIATNDAGNVIVSGWTNGWLMGPVSDFQDAFVVKYAANGVEQWGHQLGTAADAQGVAADAAGNVAAAGNTDDARMFVVSYAADGRERWIRRLSPAFTILTGGGVVIDAPGNVVVTGSTTGSLGGPHNGGWDVIVAGYSPDGRLLWMQQPGTASDDWPLGLSLDAATGNFILGWHAYDDLHGEYSTYFSVYSSNGALLKTLPVPRSPSGELISAFATDGAGNIYTAGMTVNDNPEESIFFLNKYAPLVP